MLNGGDGSRGYFVLNSALFLDRDGVINRDEGYTHIWNEELLIDGVCDLIRRFKEKKFLVIVVTNQSGIGRGFFSSEQFHLFMYEMRLSLQKYSADVDDYYHCPCLPSVPLCWCRKPNPGMLIKAISKYNIAPEQSILVGDKVSDILAASSANVSKRYLFSQDTLAGRKRINGKIYEVVNSLSEVK